MFYIFVFTLREGSVTTRTLNILLFQSRMSFRGRGGGGGGFRGCGGGGRRGGFRVGRDGRGGFDQGPPTGLVVFSLEYKYSSM